MSIPQDFSGKVAIVTGAGLGIGFEIARTLAQHGASVVLNDMKDELARSAAFRIEAEGGKCVASVGNAADTAYIREMVDLAVRQFGRLDIAVANAGITTFGGFFEYSPEQFQTLVALNLQGSFFFAQAAAWQMRKQGEGGRIIFLSSVTAHQAHQDLVAYGMTKAALEQLAKNMVVEIAPYRITANCVAPGATLTERTRMESADYEGEWKRLIPMGRAASPADIANACIFLASDPASHITGQTIVVDGGWTAISPTPGWSRD